jgi:hypothetical protein
MVRVCPATNEQALVFSAGVQAGSPAAEFTRMLVIMLGSSAETTH